MAIVEFLKFWWENILTGWRIGYGVFGGILGIFVLVTAAFYFRKKHYQRKLKRWEKIVMKLSFFLFIITFLIAAVFIAPFLKYQNRENEPIDRDTRKEIRTLLESVNPEILKRIDEGQKEIPVRFNTIAQVKLSELSNHQDFYRFLDFKKTGSIVSGANYTGSFIGEPNEISFTECYYLYPKDALIR